MNIAPEHAQELARFPAILRDLVEAEVAAGNEIAELGHSFPAAPCGAYVKLTRPVSTRARERTPELDFYDRNSSSYAGEFTDSKRHFFVLEPPHPPEPEPDMNAIRQEREARYAAANAAALQPPPLPPRTPEQAPATAPEPVSWWKSLFGTLTSRVERFKSSMAIDYEKWHDGAGYDLSQIAGASHQELQAMEALLIPRKTNDWRDVEALAALRTPSADQALREAFATGNSEIRMAVEDYAPHLISEQERTRSLIRAIEESEIYGGLTQTLRQVRRCHPPEVIRALVRGLTRRDGGTATHLAGMLFFLHGKSREPFDWQHREVFLRFNTPDPEAREKAARELCDRLGLAFE